MVNEQMDETCMSRSYNFIFGYSRKGEVAYSGTETLLCRLDLGFSFFYPLFLLKICRIICYFSIGPVYLKLWFLTSIFSKIMFFCVVPF